MKKLLLSLCLVNIILTLNSLPVNAGECFQGNVQYITGTTITKNPVFLRNNPCIGQSAILATIPEGNQVTIIGFWDGWYKIEYKSTRGWVYGTFVNNFNTSNQNSLDYQQFESQYPSRKINNSSSTNPLSPSISSSVPLSSDLTTRMKGYILLQVESHGEAWYLNPITNKRYYMKDGETAYQMMRAFGLGITEADYTRLESGDITLRKRLTGRIVLRVQAHGEAYYIHPQTLNVNYLKDGNEAYRIMRIMSLGITNADLNKIPSGEFTPPPTKPSTSTTASNTTIQKPLSLSSKQEGVIPSNLNLIELNKYWLTKVNALRTQQNLRQLVLDQRFLDTAAEWSAVMGTKDELTHTRDDGKTMHQWIDTKGLTFTTRYSPDGWTQNYFTENIAWDYTENTMASAKATLDHVMEAFLSEAGDNGPHYRTQYHPDWNSVGIGFYFVPATNNTFKTYMTFHYGSLK